MTDLEALVSLNMAGAIGSIRLKRLLEYFGRAQRILEASPEKLTVVSGVKGAIARRIHNFRKEDLSRELALAEKYGLKILTFDSPVYPLNLKSIPDPPIVLYVKGEFKEADALSIAMVGSRRASIYGLKSAGRFAAALAEQGFTIVSGLARGVDTASHCGALKAGGRTIAVLGSGFSHLYPRENQGLAAEIALSGAVISEFPLGILPLRENFPRRNRVISGLSLGVLVVEAARNSGALITADFALEQGREVFALPGEFDASNSWGTNSLIKQGAKLVSNLEDILEELAAFITPQPCRPQALIDRPSGLSEEEARAYGLLTTEAVHIDELVQKTELDISRISAILLRLQLKNLIREFPGKHYARTKDAEKELSYS